MKEFIISDIIIKWNNLQEIRLILRIKEQGVLQNIIQKISVKVKFQLILVLLIVLKLRKIKLKLINLFKKVNKVKFSMTKVTLMSTNLFHFNLRQWVKISINTNEI